MHEYGGALSRESGTLIPTDLRPLCTLPEDYLSHHATPLTVVVLWNMRDEESLKYPCGKEPNG